eukprot:1899287-Prymnesium_polylepis.1
MAHPDRADGTLQPRRYGNPYPQPSLTPRCSGLIHSIHSIAPILPCGPSDRGARTLFCALCALRRLLQAAIETAPLNAHELQRVGGVESLVALFRRCVSLLTPTCAAPHVTPVTRTRPPHVRCPLSSLPPGHSIPLGGSTQATRHHAVRPPTLTFSDDLSRAARSEILRSPHPRSQLGARRAARRRRAAAAAHHLRHRRVTRVPRNRRCALEPRPFAIGTTAFCH